MKSTLVEREGLDEVAFWTPRSPICDKTYTPSLLLHTWNGSISSSMSQHFTWSQHTNILTTKQRFYYMHFQYSSDSTRSQWQAPKKQKANIVLLLSSRNYSMKWLSKTKGT